MSSANDFGTLMFAQNNIERWKAERENATARLELAQMNERIAHLVSQHEPVASLGLDRERLRIALRFIQHGDLGRLSREFAALRVDLVRRDPA